jgi:5-methyltetrahydrofolate--homocysteine methyltransferase
MEMVRAANVLNSTDANCYNWIMKYRDHTPSAAADATSAGNTVAASSGGRRRGGRAARMGS